MDEELKGIIMKRFLRKLVNLNIWGERFPRLNKVESSLWDGRDKTKIINNQCERVYWEATKIKHQYRLSNEGVGRFF